MGYRILLAAAFLLFCYAEAINVPGCPALYRRYSASHSYCQPKNDSCTIVKQGCQDKIAEILKLHNHFRTIMAKQQKGSNGYPPAANMMELEWDDELSKVAQKRAESCIYAHDKNEAREVQRFDVGQNIAKIYDSDDISEPDWEKAITAFFGEINNMTPAQLCGGRDLEKTGHFTALTWAHTFKVGCGYTQFEDGKKYTELYYCDYGPGGNYEDQCIYEKGPACSKCPSNTKCIEDAGLCKLNNPKEFPEQPKKADDDEDYFFHCDFKNPSPEGDCGFTKKGDGDWKLFKSYDYDYLETVLQPGQNGTITFSKHLTPPAGTNIKEFCIGWRYRKGPNFAKDTANNLGKIFVSPDIPGLDPRYVLTYDLQLNNPKFALRGATFLWNLPTQVEVSFAVPEDSTPQYININEIFAYMGRCKFG